MRSEPRGSLFIVKPVQTQIAAQAWIPRAKCFTNSGRRSHRCKFDGLASIDYDRTAGWSSLVARWAHNPKVGGSNPPPATIYGFEGLPA